MMRRMLPPALTLALTLFGASVWGHYPGIPYADWMMSLTRPDYPMSSCCGMADQYYVREYGPSQQNSVAFAAVVIGIEGEPDFSVEIPREKVIWNRVNPTGRGVIFIQDGWGGREVLCFLPGMGM
jgi:hypothetical protein